ncbi:E3 ubiquitin-protein ligase TRIM39-like [Solea senegalensis]|uniref:E3 ubiquitin-protein ligase TRIM39-like n=1 Tax=Solea senegalensis TaxID=28829 RepID=A0AAV6QY19_SOLSE|nr:E3 ubiquitin-protein ligase TRIM39-like [Solea senegalensis]
MSRYTWTDEDEQRSSVKFVDVFYRVSSDRMSLFGSFLSDEQFQCSICLEVFTNPSSTPCGHSFCMNCISRYWDTAKVCQCPLCKKTFQKRPDLQINRTLREITEQFRSMKGGGGGGGGVVRVEKKRGGKGGGDGAAPDELFHELRKKLPRALPTPSPLTLNYDAEPQHNDAVSSPLGSSLPNSSPLSALSSALSPHHPAAPPSRSSSRRRFTVSGAASSLSLSVCDVHNRGLMIYCRTDRVCICPDCELERHQDHDTVSIEDEWRETKSQLSASEQEIQEMIRQRINKMEEIRTSVSELESAVERETAGSVCLFSALVSAVERSQAELMEVMELSRRAAAHQADAMIRQLEQEVEELRRREKALAKLAQSDDHGHCVQTFPTLSSPPPTKNWSGVSLNSNLGTGSIYRTLAALVEKFNGELRNIAEKGFTSSALEPSPVPTQPRMKRVQEYAVDVTLDCNTAHPRLILSEDMKSVKCGDKHQLLPDNPERFDRVVCVLGRQAMSSGRHYWEVEVGGKTDWDLGVAKQSINRKGKIEVNPINGYWFLSLRNKNKYAIRTAASTDVHLNLQPHKIGVFVDYDKGQVSFYNVDAKIHIYTFNDTFGESIFPFFSPCTNKSGKNDAPLVITPVNVTE